MRSFNKSLSIIVVLAGILIIAGCGSKQSNSHGDAIQNRSPIDMGTILKDPNSFAGQTVTVQGKIVRECPTGCWLDLQGDNGALYVDLNPSGFAIPQKVGKTALIEGEVKVKNNKATLVGKGVEIQ